MLKKLKINIEPNTLIAAIALIVGIISLWVSLYSQWWIQRPKLQFVQSEFPDFYYVDTAGLNLSNAGQAAVIKISIYNMSAGPITISSFSLVKNDYTGDLTQEHRSLNPQTDRLGELMDIGFSHGGWRPNEDLLITPITINGYGYIEGYVIFPYISGYEQDQESVKILANTAYDKEFSYSVSITKSNAGIYWKPAHQPPLTQ